MNMPSMARSYEMWQNPPVAKKTMIAGFTPRATIGRRPHLVAVVAIDGVVLGDLSTACEVFGLAMRKDGRPACVRGPRLQRVCGRRIDTPGAARAVAAVVIGSGRHRHCAGCQRPHSTRT